MTQRTDGGRLARTLGVVLVPLFLAGLTAAIMLQARTPGSEVFDEIPLLLGFGGFAVVGTVLLLRRGDNPVSWLVALVPLVLSIAVPAEAWAGYVMTARGRPDGMAVFGAWLNSWYWYVLLAVVFAFLPLVFPDGRLPSRRWRIAVAVPAVGAVAAGMLAAVAQTLHGQNIDYVIDNPIGIAGVAPLEQNPAFVVIGPLLLIGFVAGVTALIVRFRRGTGVQRAQLKWFLAAVGLFVMVPPTEGILPALSSALFSVALLGLPTAIGIAVLRYRLYEIDRILSRTVAYGLATAVLAGIYALVAVVPTVIFDLQSDLLVAGATLVAAAAFGPVRRKMKALVDRRFNRQRYDAARVAEGFAVRLRDEVDLDELAADLRGVVAATVQPTRVSLWLRGPEAL